MSPQVIAAVVRAMLQFGGGAAFFVSDDDLMQGASLLVAGASLAWSIWQKNQAKRAARTA